MSRWNYRVVHDPDAEADAYRLAEVFYLEEDPDKVSGCVDTLTVAADTLDDLKRVVAQWMIRAFELPTITAESGDDLI